MPPPQPRPKAPRTHTRLDPLSVTIERGVEIPEPAPHTIVSPYRVLFDRMKPGEMVRLPDNRAHSFVKWAQKAKVAVTARRVDVGVKGVWRSA